MKINLNGQDTCLVTTDTWTNGAHLNSAAITSINTIMYGPGEEGQVLVWMGGGPKWVKMPSMLEMYLKQAENGSI